jgi:hypothetical protein
MCKRMMHNHVFQEKLQRITYAISTVRKLKYMF